MDFSKMRHRITFLKPDRSAVNSMGETVMEYKEYKTVWAQVVPRSGREYDEADKLRPETSYDITTRYFGGITTDMRIRFRSRELRIEAVLNTDERNEQLRISAVEYGKNGGNGNGKSKSRYIRI